MASKTSGPFHTGAETGGRLESARPASAHCAPHQELPLSHVTHIWHEPTPATWAQAEAIFQNRVGRATPPQARFAQLAGWVRSAWPAVVDERTVDAPDGVVDHAVWSLAPAGTSTASTTPDSQTSAR